MKKKILLLLLIPYLMVSLCFGSEITTARGLTLLIKNDTVLYGPISYWNGTIEDVEDVTFVGWNFARDTPHTEVFVNCSNLTFINCNLVNVELQEDFTVDGSLIMHKREYEAIGVKYEDIEYKNGETKTYRIDTDEMETPILLSTEDTLNAKKIKVKYVNPNTRVIRNLNAVAIIE